MFSSTELRILEGATGELLKGTKLHDKLLGLIESTEAWEQQQSEEEKERSAAIPKEVPDFSEVQSGTLVVRSEAWKSKPLNRRKDAIGIITRIRFYDDILCGRVAYPHIHWEGTSAAVLCEPDAAALRDGTKLPTVIMNSNTVTAVGTGLH